MNVWENNHFSNERFLSVLLKKIPWFYSVEMCVVLIPKVTVGIKFLFSHDDSFCTLDFSLRMMVKTENLWVFYVCIYLCVLWWVGELLYVWVWAFIYENECLCLYIWVIQIYDWFFFLNETFGGMIGYYYIYENNDNASYYYVPPLLHSIKNTFKWKTKFCCKQYYFYDS